MKIGVIGPGAVGSYYSAMLSRIGHDVWLLLRSDYQAVRRDGVHIRSPRGDFHVHPQAASAPAEIGPCDLVLVALKTTANDALRTLLPPLVKDSTVVLTLQNGLGNEEALAEIVPPSQIMGGLCFVCLNRLSPGVILHIDHGLVVLGEFASAPLPRTHSLADEFTRAGVTSRVSDDLAKAHWEKLVWNIPFNGLGVAGSVGLQNVLAGTVSATPGPVLTTDLLLGNAQWTALVRELMLEVIHAGRAMGHPIPESFADELIGRTRTMGAYKASTLIDFERQQPLELESLFLNPLRCAQKAGARVPRLEALCQVLVNPLLR